MLIHGNISSATATLLGAWASVSRTLDVAEDACEHARPLQGESLRERFAHCANEISAIKPALDDMHRTIRDVIWRNRRKETSRSEKIGLYLCVAGLHGYDSWQAKDAYWEFSADPKFIELIDIIRSKE